VIVDIINKLMCLTAKIHVLYCLFLIPLKYIVGVLQQVLIFQCSFENISEQMIVCCECMCDNNMILTCISWVVHYG
jgi:uncharacterized membrane protein YGL010W